MIAKKIAEELNMEIEISTTSSSSALKGVGNGNFHMAMAGFTTDISRDDITFTDNYYGDYVIILGNKNQDINKRICIALSKLKSAGDIDTIAKKYNLESTPAKEPETKPESKPESEEKQQTATEQTTTEGTGISYRVRKSADDSSSQAGAFSSLENAKKEANARKDEGYRVYDMSGNLIYTP